MDSAGPRQGVCKHTETRRFFIDVTNVSDSSTDSRETIKTCFINVTFVRVKFNLNLFKPDSDSPATPGLYQ